MSVLLDWNRRTEDNCIICGKFSPFKVAITFRCVIWLYSRNIVYSESAYIDKQNIITGIYKTTHFPGHHGDNVCKPIYNIQVHVTNVENYSIGCDTLYKS